MNKQQKGQAIDSLSEKFKNSQYFYFIDESGLNASKTSSLRRKAFEKNISYTVVKNTIIQKALEKSELSSDELLSTLKGPTAVFFSDSVNEIAKLIKDFKGDNPKPSFKAAYIDSDIFVGENQLDALVSLKSKEELLGEIVGLLQSPIKNVISGLKSSAGDKVGSIVEALGNR